MGLKITGLVKFVPNAGTSGANDANLTISNASYSGTSFSVSGQDGLPTGIFFNDVGTKMFMVGYGNDRVHQYTLGTGFDLSSASYDSVSLDVSSQDNTPLGIFFNSTGTKMFMVGFGNDRVYQYTLSTGFDLSSASYDSVSFSVSSQDGLPTGIFFNSVGTKMFMVGANPSDSVHQYTLGTGFDLSTASYDSVSFDVSSQDIGPRGIFFNSTGTKMFMVGANNDRIYQYTLSTGFDLSTASYDSVSFDVSSQDTFPTGIFFNSSGTKMFMLGRSSDSVYEYNL
jgi:hypothetical protein